MENCKYAIEIGTYAAGDLLWQAGKCTDLYRYRQSNECISLDGAQNLYIVKGKPAWSGSFAVAAINGCGKFTPLEFIFSEDGQGCHAEAKRISDGKLCVSTEITMQLAKNEGWIVKSGSKWKTMPQQMMMYRAASFFAKVYCPEILFGIQTVEEVKDTKGYDETEKQTVKISLEDSYGKFQ